MLFSLCGSCVCVGICLLYPSSEECCCVSAFHKLEEAWGVKSQAIVVLLCISNNTAPNHSSLVIL